MKKLFIVSFLVINNYAFSQQIKEIYKFDVPVDNDGLQYKEGHLVKVVNIVGSDRISFVYLKFKKNKNVFKKNKNDSILNSKYYYAEQVPRSLSNNNPSNANSLNLKIHTIDKSTFKKSTSIYHFYHRFKGVKAGLFTVPFKIRLNDFDFEQNVNLGMSLSFRFRMNREIDNDWLLSPTIGVGLSTVKLNPKNSNLTESEDNDTNRTASAFSLSGGFLIELKHSINLSLQYGFDFLGNDDKNIEWKYNKKPWLGIGINIGFPISDKNEENKNNKKNTSK